MSVPLLDVNAQNLPLQEQLNAAFQEVLLSGRFIMGPAIEQIEGELAAMVGVRHAIAVSSGTDALLAALMAFDLGPGDEVICPTFTFFATAGAIARTGATPVFVDICPICFNIDPNAVRDKITPRTRAIVPVHLFGQSADMDAILVLAKEHGLIVLEDAAQAVGARYRGRACGSFGQFGTYSFFPSKNLGGFGDGGLIVTDDDALAARARSLRNHGMEPKYYHHTVGGNFRMDTIQAALLRVKLPHYAAYTSARQANAAWYQERLGVLHGVVKADPAHCKCVSAQDEALHEANASLVLPIAYPHNEHIWNQFTLRVLHGRRDAMRQHLMAAGIGCEIYYPLTLDQQVCFAHLPEASRNHCPTAHRMAQEVLSIPIYPELSESQRDEVFAAIESFLLTSP